MSTSKCVTWEDIKNDPNAKRIGEHGFVYLKSVYGDDSTICEAARISYGKGTKSVQDDRNLIRYLVRHSHTSPVEQVCATWVLKLPLFVMGQLVRHRTAKLNQYSGRYSEMPEEYFIPTEWRKQSTSNKQGGEEVMEYDDQTMHEGTAEEISFGEYSNRLRKGVSRELARICLPQSVMTMTVWQCDLHNTMHFLRLRMDSHAQKEIRDYANAMYELLVPKFPITMEAFDDYKRDAKTFSRMEMLFMRDIMSGVVSLNIQQDKNKLCEKYGLSGREYDEFLAKLIPPTVQ